MKMTIKGIERTDYVSKKTDKPVNGVKFHVIYKSGNVIGETVESVFISDTKIV